MNRNRVALLGLSLALVTGCSTAAPTTLSPTAPSAVPSVVERTAAAGSVPPAVPATPASGGTAAPTLPDGLAVRPGRPALVDGEAAACIPGCAVGRAAGGKVPAGRYQTEWFFGGYMTIETDGSWQRTEDSNGELSLPVSGTGDDTYRLAFFLDPALVVDDRIQDVPRTAEASVEWLRGHAELVVSEPIATTLGSLPATAIDIRLAPTAPHQYADCPAACVTFLKVAAFDHSDGILGDDVYRFYFADVSYSSSDHMLVVKVEGRDDADLDAVVERVEPVLRTVKVPARAGHTGS
jgi:hypothetical protein